MHVNKTEGSLYISKRQFNINNALMKALKTLLHLYDSSYVLHNTDMHLYPSITQRILKVVLLIFLYQCFLARYNYILAT